MQRLLKTFALALISFLLILQVLLPPLVASGLKRVVINSFDLGENKAAVSVWSLPSVKLLGGYMDRLHVSLKGLSLDGIEARSMLLETRGARVDIENLTTRRELLFSGVGTGEITVEFEADSVNAFFTRQYRGYIQSPEVVLGNNGVTLKGHVTYFGRKLPVALFGRVVPGTGMSIDFVPTGVEVLGMEVPPVVKDRLLQRISVGFSFHGVPFQGRVAEVVVSEGLLVLKVRFES